MQTINEKQEKNLHVRLDSAIKLGSFIFNYNVMCC